MASVKVVEVPPVLPVKQYVLTLSEREADALLSLSMFIGGDPRYSPRGVIDGILHKLGDVMKKAPGQTDAYKAVTEPKNDNAIRFDNYSFKE